MREKDGRRLFAAILGGKMIAAALVCGMIYGLSNFVGTALAEDAAPLPVHINALNTVWVLVAAFLVFFMQAGFMMLEAGFARGRETVNILLEGIVDTALCGILFWAWGFAFLFGKGNGFIGLEYFFLHGAPETYGATGIPMLAFWLFQFAFADTCSTITSGAMVGRTGFLGDLLYSFGVSGLIYPIIGHWAWGPDGWLAAMNFRDFAGSTVVHTIGGFVALAGAIALGPRLGRKFKRDGGGMPPGHDMTIAAVGGVILWFGWYGFNPGSTLSAMDLQGMSRVAANTTLAAAAGALGALFFYYPRHKIWDTGFTVNGFLAGLVAITAPCYWVSPLGAILIGGIAGVVVILVFDLIEWLRIDDPIGAFAVHGANGIWGTLSLGLFATGQFAAPGPGGMDVSGGMVKGLLYGGGFAQLKVQLIGSAAVTLATFGVAMLMMYAVKATGTLRVSEEGELMGIDLHEHGGFAYPEIMSPWGTTGSGGVPAKPAEPARVGAAATAAAAKSA
jgi:Amt family ammonium transporter